MYLGIDLGTSGVKVVAVDRGGEVVAQHTAALTLSTPQPRWSEQDPDEWWTATSRAVRAVSSALGERAGALRAVGLSGQMHGATVLDEQDRPLRPAILWNDGRSDVECAELERDVPELRRITGNKAMPGFTAPKLQWLRRHEPEVFGTLRRVLLPKDYLRLRMTGDAASDLSDSAGTLWLDVAERRWSAEVLDACGLSIEQMPSLFEGTEATGVLRAEVAENWGVPVIPVAAGAGDQAAGAAGVGVVEPGDAFLSLGTSGVLFVATRDFRPRPERAVHTFCHCFPQRWHQMSVLLSAASCLHWLAGVLGESDEASMLRHAEPLIPTARTPIFLPYLTGERTPHDDPHARGVFFGLGADTERADLVRSVLEGVAFAFADAQEVLLEGGGELRDVTLIGGGSRSRAWAEILASALGRTLTARERAEVGPAMGAARLAQIAVGDGTIASACTAPPALERVEPNPELCELLAPRRETFRDLYPRLRPAFRRDD